MANNNPATCIFRCERYHFGLPNLSRSPAAMAVPYGSRKPHDKNMSIPCHKTTYERPGIAISLAVSPPPRVSMKAPRRLCIDNDGVSPMP